MKKNIKEIHFKHNISSKFGITLDQYNKMHSAQKGRCKICNIHESELLPKSKLGIDHCHKSGKIRGLLCGRCNAALGKFKDNEKIIIHAIKYLKKHQ